jgi:hypothetical protein
MPPFEEEGDIALHLSIGRPNDLENVMIHVFHKWVGDE